MGTGRRVDDNTRKGVVIENLGRGLWWNLQALSVRIQRVVINRSHIQESST